MSFFSSFLAMIVLSGCCECFGRKCYLTSCSYDGCMKWTLPKEYATECSELVLGGHSSHCPDRQTVLLFNTTFVTSNREDVQNILSTASSNMPSQATSTENSLLTTTPSCETGRTQVNYNCSEQCTCIENQWVCNSTYKCNLNATCTVLEDEGQCICKKGYTGDGETCKSFYKDCQEAYLDGHKQNGVYTILPTEWPETPFNVSCDMTTDDGGWTIFQRREDGETNFYRNWTSYKHGFGSLVDGKDFWLGNEKIFYLTNQGEYKLRVDIVTADNEPKYEIYETFRIGNESSHYQMMELGQTNGNAGDALLISKGHSFSTFDRDNDECDIFNCAKDHNGAWWYTNRWCEPCHNTESYCDDFVTGSSCHNVCAKSNLNGGYNGGLGKNINWHFASYCNIRETKMMIKTF